MKKIKEFFNWLNVDAPEWVVGSFTVSCIVVLGLTFSVLFFVTPFVFLTLMLSLVAFFILHPIYLFYKENKDASDS